MSTDLYRTDLPAGSVAYRTAVGRMTAEFLADRPAPRGRPDVVTRWSGIDMGSAELRRRVTRALRMAERRGYLPEQVESLDGLPHDLRSLYRPNDGGYRLDQGAARARLAVALAGQSAPSPHHAPAHDRGGSAHSRPLAVWAWSSTIERDWRAWVRGETDERPDWALIGPDHTRPSMAAWRDWLRALGGLQPTGRPMSTSATPSTVARDVRKAVMARHARPVLSHGAIVS